MVSCAWLAGAVGCSARDTDPVAVAQVAVRANPDLELVATDAQQGVLTVRVKRTDRVITVRAADVVAGTAFRDLDKTDPAPVAPAPAAVESPAPSMSAAATPAPPAPVSTPAARPPVARPAAAPKSAAASAPQASAAPQTPAPAPAPTSAASGGASIDESRLQRRTSTMQCMDTQSLNLDGVLIDADKVAVQAMGNCHVRITNSKLVGRVGLLMMGSATATIENTVIEGTVSIRAMGTSAIAVRSSTISGRIQKMQNGSVQDLGQNIWR